MNSAARDFPFDLVETGESCPATGRRFLTHPTWKYEDSRFGMRMELFGERVIVDRVFGEYLQSAVEPCSGSSTRPSTGFPVRPSWSKT